MKNLIFILALSLVSFDLTAQFKILPDDGDAEDFFGEFVSIYGDYALIGAPKDDDSGDDSGSAYIFKNIDGAWVQQAKLLPDDGQAGDWFGSILSIYDDYALIGAPLSDINGDKSGMVYVFKRSDKNWEQIAKIVPEDGSAGDRFGVGISAHKDYVIIGADAGSGSGAGAAYIFKRNGEKWEQQAKVYPEDGEDGDLFGHYVAMYGNYAVSTAVFNENRGAVYVYKQTEGSWIKDVKLQPVDGAEDDYFGNSVSIFDDCMVVGSPLSDVNGVVDCGAVYVYRNIEDLWQQEAKLTTLDKSQSDWLGQNVSVFEDCILANAPVDDDNGVNSGSVYIFKKDTESWIQQSKLIAVDGAAYDWFGINVANFKNHAVMGVWRDDDNGYNSGAAFAYDLTGVLPEQINVLKNNHLDLFPNPAKGKVSVLNTTEKPIDQIRIFNSFGKKLEHQPLKNDAFDISRYPPGVYFVEIKSDRFQVVKKLIVEE